MSVVTPASPPTLQIVKMDQGGVNERILAKETKADFRRIEAASIKMPARFTSAEGKRFFVRLFSTLQLNAHFISVIARTRLDHEDIAKVEAALRERMEKVTDTLNNQVVTRLRQQYLDLANREADWAQKYGPDHRAVINMQGQMKEIRNSISDELRRLAETYKSDNEIAKQREEDIQFALTKVI